MRPPAMFCKKITAAEQSVSLPEPVTPGVVFPIHIKIAV